MALAIELFGKKVNFKNNICSSDGKIIVGRNLRYNLYISITDVCLANCPFCNNNTKKHCTKTDTKFDIEKLKVVLKELKSKKLINRISITGGEPLLNINLLNDVLNVIYEICGEKQLVTINTNGVNLDKILQLDKIDKVYGVHISRHHYDDEINDKIFGFKTAHIEDIERVIEKASNKKLIRLNSLLIKGYIDSKEKVIEYLETAGEMNIFRVGFVGLMPLNDYSKEHFVEYKEIFNKLCEDSLKTNYMQNRDICDCLNGIYLTSEGNLVEYYARTVRNLNPCDVGQLSYTSDNKLCAGFGNVIF